MKFTLTFKTPDVLDEVDIPENLDEDEVREFKQRIKDFTSQWMRYKEYIIIEFDTDKNTAVVKRLNDFS